MVTYNSPNPVAHAKGKVRAPMAPSKASLPWGTHIPVYHGTPYLPREDTSCFGNYERSQVQQCRIGGVAAELGSRTSDGGMGPYIVCHRTGLCCVGLGPMLLLGDGPYVFVGMGPYVVVLGMGPNICWIVARMLIGKPSLPEHGQHVGILPPTPHPRPSVPTQYPSQSQYPTRNILNSSTPCNI